MVRGWCVVEGVPANCETQKDDTSTGSVMCCTHSKLTCPGSAKLHVDTNEKYVRPRNHSVLGEVAPLVLQVYGSTAILEFVLGQSQGPLAPSQRHYRGFEVLHFFLRPRMASPGPASFLGLYLARGGGKRSRFGRLQERPSDKHADSVTTRGVACTLWCKTELREN